MYYKPLMLPLFMQVLLIFIVWLKMYHDRINEIRLKKIDPQQLSTRENARRILTDSAVSADHFRNQFEMPVLFFVAILLALVSMWIDPVMVALTWVYVALRAMHSIIHMTYNNVMHRFWVYFASCIALMGIWGRLGWYIILF